LNSKQAFPIEPLNRLPGIIKYQLYSLLASGIINEYQLSPEWMEKLESTPVHITENILESIRSKKTKCFDPLKLFVDMDIDDSLMERQLYRHKLLGWNHARIKKVIVTPTRIILTGPQTEMTNRIVRTYHEKSDQFLRITFTDEDFEPLAHDNIVYQNVYSRVRNILDQGLDIGNDHYSFLHYSNR
jgi:RNA-dependent RNA polymerase